MSADPADPSVVSGAAWDALVETLRRSSRLVLGAGVPDAPAYRAAGFRYLTRLFAAGLVTCVEFADPDYPEFGRMIDPSMKWGLDCPDCLYLYASVRGDASYRIWGNRGSANHIDLQVNFGHFAYGDISQWGTVASISGLEIQTERMGARLAYRIDCPAELRGLSLPPLLVQPLVENAVRHGLEPRPGGGEVRIRAGLEEDALFLEVRDDGAGIAAQGRSGVGLANVRARVRAVSQGRGSVVIQPVAPHGLSVRIALPLPGDPGGAARLAADREPP